MNVIPIMEWWYGGGWTISLVILPFAIAFYILTRRKR
jgi:hypothetical protein